MARTFRSEAIVLRTSSLGEADKIITLISKEKGKLAAVAKGIRRSKSRFGARFELFNNLSLTFFKGRSLPIITQAEIIDGYLRLRRNFSKINYAYAMVELLDKMTPEYQQEARYYKLLAASLSALNKLSVDSKLVLAAFDVKLLAISGFMPELSRCISCKSKSGLVGFDSGRGGVVCQNCASSGQTVQPISPSLTGKIKELLYAPFSLLFEVKINPTDTNLVSNLVKTHLTYHLHLQLKSRLTIAVDNKNLAK